MCPVSGALGIGAEMVGSAVPGRLADDAGVAITGKFPPELPLDVVAPELLPSTSVNWSSRSDSSRPFEASSWYPERVETESAYHAVTFVLTRTTDPPDAVDVTCTADW